MSATIEIRGRAGRLLRVPIEKAVESAARDVLDGDLQDAVAVLEKILRVQPFQPNALYLRGIAYLRACQPGMAVPYLQKAVSRVDNISEWQTNLGFALSRSGRAEEAAAAFGRVVALEPDSTSALSNLSGSMLRLKRFEEAAAAAERALAIDGKHADSLCNLSAALVGLKRFEAAEVSARKALQLKPDDPDCLSNLGSTLYQLSRFEEAVKELSRAAWLRPVSADACVNLISTLAAMRRPYEGLEWCGRGLAWYPDEPRLYYGRALALLLSGQLGPGWKDYEWRWKSGQLEPRQFAVPLWDGADPHGRTVLLHAEQGLGDTIQFVRYVSLVAARGATVVLEAPKTLMRLLSGLPGVHKLIARGDELPPFDWQCPLLSLPLAFGTTLESIPNQVPYLHADHELQSKWKTRLNSGGRLKVGLAWAGSPTHLNDHNRSIPFERLLPLLDVPGTAFYSFQVGPAVRDLERLGVSGRVQDLSPDLAPDFAQTAAALAEIDLLITVDTSVAHLAGALGVRTWLLVPYAPDWRWLLDREDSPWYPGMRLFRQSAPKDWPGVVGRVTEEVRILAASGAGDAAPATATAPAQPPTDFARWSDPRNLDPAWDERANLAADFIPAGATVLDLGCGAMALERYLPPGCSYQPCDLVRRDDRTLLCDFNRDEVPVPTGVTHITVLGVLEYMSDWRAFLRQLRRANVPVVLSYSPTDFTSHLNRPQLGWINHLDLRTLCNEFEKDGFYIQTSLRVGSSQIMLRLIPGTRPARLSRKVAVLSYNNIGNFGDRLGYHLVNGLLPPETVVRYGHFKPWDLPDGDFDLAIVGVGNSLFQPILSDELLAFLDRVPQSIGIFGTQYRQSIDSQRLGRVLDRLSVWYARHEEDVLLYGGGRNRVVHLGDWLINAFPMSQWTKDEVLNIGPEILQDLPLDRTIQTIQEHRSVFSTRVHPLLCALSSAEQVAYSEQRNSSGNLSGKFGSMLMDIFGRKFPEQKFFRFDRDCVASYRSRVQAAMAGMPDTLASLLGLPTSR
jgi:Flp pilus assembly protein TadD